MPRRFISAHRTCPGCGVEFSALNGKVKFCTKECRSLTWVSANGASIKKHGHNYQHSAHGKSKRAVWEKKNAEHLHEYKQTHYAANKDQILAVNSVYAEANPEIVRAAQRKYQKTEHGRQKQLQGTWRRLARIKNAPGRGVTAAQFNDLCERFDFNCVSCNTKFERSDLSMDHCHPISKGGEHDIDNIQPMCMPCNRAKRDTTAFYRPGFLATKIFASLAT